MGTTVRISRSLLERIVSEADRSSDEICGLLLGYGDRIEEARPCRNVDATPAVRFELDPAALFAALRAARQGGPKVLGHYHSHPSGIAAPSLADAAAAAPDRAVWLITAGGEITAWRAVSDGAVHGRFDPLTLAIAP
ncbi:Mov34/MPN/PAD-1 family protein [uncultured Sphingomonas sp.]|uniref:Mov34/MPN/PAD-1 family protein n=1 Tax=unclassified Sphingomonas TaxID=196159 RepID=UPI0025F62BD3|nr:Mov34/MPN/PAD-1 family protein [uncultured Sphingomonas sp.]